MHTFLLRDVDTASEMMRRCYRIVKESMRSMAGYMVKMQSWPGKKMLAKHIWLDAVHADWLRTRTLELRYPRVDVDEDSDRHLIRVLEKLPNASSDAEFLSLVYTVIKPALLESLRAYLAQSDPLDDAPSHIVLGRILPELEMELHEYEALASTLTAGASSSTTAAAQELTGLLAACGGVFGPDRDPGEAFAAYFGRPDYVVPSEGGREPSWSPAVMQVPPREPRNPIERRVWIAIDHANEVWAAETPAALIWAYKGLAWPLYLNAARWCYDEMRHAMMGEQRLAAMGFEIGVDYPMVPDHWRTYSHRGLGSLLLLLHGLEQKGPLNKSKMKLELTEQHDLEGAQDCDYDWADESGHISFGLAWIKAVFPDWSKERIMAETQEIVTDWVDWIKRYHAEGLHQYDGFMARIEGRVADYMEAYPA
ncbi:hypothetical protein [Paenibacillus koleovorans]|uniref:hypothetical protein n=1 Tax=Paenibacillus koleovorans TaxID=121608 RepID=UPI000FDCBEE2|nr:hypothetical protein [Paenibacillus koleovorans]